MFLPKRLECTTRRSYLKIINNIIRYSNKATKTLSLAFDVSGLVSVENVNFGMQFQLYYTFDGFR